ncbi:potassium-transporting ATPase subunit KdpA [Campylobacter jejuni]|uniref:potassium-transporting ATPase subunit KdpA n=1 Tax=Campylobacter jejuni TaxID=197 RepID=UPI00223D10E2|nr:potassium-transporting ATPase subunit KdpA [Campylobacter jejuni]
MGIIFIISLLLIYFSEKMSNPNLDSLGLNANLGNLEGKEIRFGTDGSSLFSAVTTAFTTGSVNNMHDSLNPLSISATLLNMMLNIAFGGEGVGLMNMIIYVLLTVFICVLMIGRTPEFLGKKNRKRTNEAYSFGNSYPSFINPCFKCISCCFCKR